MIKLLNNDEKQLLDTILYMAGLHKHINDDRPEQIKKLKDRLLITEGELVAGNDSPEVIKELKETLMKSYHLGIISLVNVRKHLKQFEINK